jgi:hypothetical protein
MARYRSTAPADQAAQQSSLTSGRHRAPGPADLDRQAALYMDSLDQQGDLEWQEARYYQVMHWAMRDLRPGKGSEGSK